jgi:DNA-binding response OmpR family regulator
MSIRFITAVNGQIDFDVMNETEFDLIVSGLVMQVLVGWGFLTRVREGTHQQEIPAMTLTAPDSEKDCRRARKCGFDRYKVGI